MFKHKRRRARLGRRMTVLLAALLGLTLFAALAMH